MNFIFSVDLEDWYHLEYLKKYNLEKKPYYIERIYDFLLLLEEKKIKSTFFILGELIKNNKQLILDISNSGHEIAVHGWDHQLLNKKSNNNFKNEIKNTKILIEDLISKEILGYRALVFP